VLRNNCAQVVERGDINIKMDTHTVFWLLNRMGSWLVKGQDGMRRLTRGYVGDSNPGRCEQPRKDNGALGKEDSRKILAMDNPQATALVGHFEWLA
jgi:hypothetical protein